MPHFRRQQEPFIATQYQEYRAAVREDFRQQCAYCLMHELLADGEENFELDHFRPKKRFPHLIVQFENIYYACHPCNHFKSSKWPPEALEQQGIGFADLCSDEFATHFVSKSDGRWEGVTVRGRYSIDQLRLNRSHLVDLRSLLAEFGIAVHLERVDADVIHRQMDILSKKIDSARP
jgi:hypothetical protein